jgi:hypothetical protein
MRHVTECGGPALWLCAWLAGVPRSCEDAPGLGAVREPPRSGQAWLPRSAGCGGALGGAEDPVDLHEELIVWHAVCADGLDLQIGAERPVGHHLGLGHCQEPLATGWPVTVGSGVLLALSACGSAWPWMSATSSVTKTGSQLPS